MNFAEEPESGFRKVWRFAAVVVRWVAASLATLACLALLVVATLFGYAVEGSSKDAVAMMSLRSGIEVPTWITELGSRLGQMNVDLTGFIEASIVVSVVGVAIFKGMVFVTGLATSWHDFLYFSKAFLWENGSWRKWIGSVFKPLKYFMPAFAFWGACWSAAAVAEDTRPIVPEIKRVLLPLQLHVHFAKAELDDTNDLSATGVSVGSRHEWMLERTVEQLKQCTEYGQQPVTVRPYGFASDEEFTRLGKERNNRRNLQAANARARAVRERLEELDGSSIKVEEPYQWNELEPAKGMGKMVKTRCEMIPGPLENRDPFLDRAVVLKIVDPGACEIAPIQPNEEECK